MAQEFDGDYESVAGQERRRAIRVGYRTVVMMAEYDGKNLPPPLAFREVETRDLSPTGISFLTSEAPASESLVLLLGNPAQDPIYVTAKVVHCNEGFWERRRQFLIGCELTERLQN